MNLGVSPFLVTVVVSLRQAGQVTGCGLPKEILPLSPGCTSFPPIKFPNFYPRLGSSRILEVI